MTLQAARWVLRPLATSSSPRATHIAGAYITAAYYCAKPAEMPRRAGWHWFKRYLRVGDGNENACPFFYLNARPRAGAPMAFHGHFAKRC